MRGARERYAVLATLSYLDDERVQSILRGMKLMLYIQEGEWADRSRSLKGCRGGEECVGDDLKEKYKRGWERMGKCMCGVDEECEVEARLEGFLLEGGKAHVEEWIGLVGRLVRMGEGERARWWRVHNHVVGRKE